MKRIFDRFEPDDWTEDGKKILSDESVERIKKFLSRGPIIVQHWYYRGASCSRVFGFDDFEEFEEHLDKNAVPGDAFDIWSFNEVCTQDKVITEGKLHDSDGCVPLKGAY
jgi:DNA-directed RNA polymerase subunit N (RpoN/RPB10)